jgi:hypothetical protein
MPTPASGHTSPWQVGYSGKLPSRPLTSWVLRQQNLAFQGTSGVSANNQARGFAPAFLDTDTGTIHLARYADGRPAPLHLLDGLPPELVISRDPAGSGTVVKPSLITGFVRAGTFYTREQAATCG